VPDDGFTGWTAALVQGRNDLLERHTDLDPIDVLDREEFLAGLIEGSLVFIHADPSRPTFVPWTTPWRRWMDNGRDSAYWFAPLDGRHRYRVSGRRGDECYLSFTVYAGVPGHPEAVARNINHRDLHAANDDTFSFEIDPPADACYVISRQYFTEPDAAEPGTMTIEVVDGPPPQAPTASDLDARWAAATSFIQAMTRPRAVPGALPPYVSTTPNVMGDPSGWRAEEGGGRGTPDQTYASGPFDLAPDKALVMELRFPPAAYAGAALWNRFSQTVDGRLHRSTVNCEHAVTHPDGTARIVVAGRDPGVPNWLDTGGRRRGSVFWRFLLANEPPGPITSRVMRIEDLGDQELGG
jgi:hypothetical protein